MTVIYKNITIECTPEEFKKLNDIGAFEVNENIQCELEQEGSHVKDFPPYLDLPKEKL